MTVVAGTPAVVAATASRRRFWRTLVSNPLSVVSLVIIVAFFLVAALQPFIQPFPANFVNLALTNAPPFTSEFVLGGDRYGRDILSLLIAATPGAVKVTLVLAVVAIAIGVIAGLAAGYAGRWADTVASWFFSALMAVPGVVVLIALYTLLGASTTVAMIVFGVLISPSMFWMVRALTRAVRNEAYIDAARVAGLPAIRIVGRHVLTAIRGPVILMTASLAGAGLAIQAGLEFLGLGNPDEPSWGGMLTDAFNNLYLAPVQLVWPAAALGLVVGAFSLLSIGLRDVLEGTRAPVRRPRTLAAESASATPDAGHALLAIRGLTIEYGDGEAARTVVEDVSLEVAAGEIVGVVGESGSGKTQTILAALGLLPPEARVRAGAVLSGGRDLLRLPESDLRHVRGRDLGYIPQEPTANLDPSFTIGSQLVYGIRAQSEMTRAEARELARTSLQRVGIRDADRVLRLYPHQISGGMAQRVLIAGAVAVRPPLLVADEPTTALDVTVQAEVLDLIRDLQADLGLGVLIVTHNFGVVADLCDRVVVMRSGRIVEAGTVRDVFANPQHEYTRALLAAVLDDSEPGVADRPREGTR